MLEKFEAAWQTIKRGLRVAAIIIVAAIIVYLGIKSHKLISKILSFFGFKDDPVNSQVKIEHFEKVETGQKKTEQTEALVKSLKEKYLR